MSFARGTDILAYLDGVNPQSVNGATVTSGWVSVAKHPRLLAAIQVGSIAATGTVDAKLQQATSSGGAGAKDVSGAAITQFGDTDDNKQANINLNPSALDLANGFIFVRLSITGANAAALVAGQLYGLHSRYQVAADAASTAAAISVY